MRLNQKLHDNGIVYPNWTIEAAKKAKLPLHLACAFLEKESGGGHNVFGHDQTIFAGAGVVTPSKYAQYKAERRRTGKMQGVGPMQLTWYSFQDEADRLGGAWVPLHNMTVGFSIASALIRRLGLKQGIAAYNGSGPAAQAYANSVLQKAEKWKRIVGPAPLAKPKSKVTAFLTGKAWSAWLYGDTDASPVLMNRLATVAKEHQRITGKKTRVHVRFGRRTRAEQLALYRAYLNGTGPLAARPGTSNHEKGLAADVGFVIGSTEVNPGNSTLLRGLLAKYKLKLPVKGEPWHVELA